jgi:hypothetical protein
MPAAKQVRPKKFLEFRILCEDNDFAVAWGKFDNDPPERLAMRWNGKPNKPGFPNQGKNPLWFMLPEELSIPLLKALLGTKSAKNQHILEVLKQLHPTAH